MQSFADAYKKLSIEYPDQVIPAHIVKRIYTLCADADCNLLEYTVFQGSTHSGSSHKMGVTSFDSKGVPIKMTGTRQSMFDSGHSIVDRIGCLWIRSGADQFWINGEPLIIRDYTYPNRPAVLNWIED